MSTLKTAGELRGFLAEVMQDLRNGKIDTAKATAIAKVSAQINQSLSVEVAARLEMKKLGGLAGDMLIGASATELLAPPANDAPKPRVFAGKPGTKVWCEQCDRNVSAAEASVCSSGFCKAMGQ